MVYYKIVQDNKIIAVGTTANLRKHQIKHNILIESSENDAQYIEVKGKIYRDKWMKAPVSEDMVAFESINIEAISEEEYSALNSTLEKDEEVTNELYELIPTIHQETNVTPVIGEDYTVDYVREVKIKEMQLACTKAITDGFSIELSDGKVHRFSMSVHDQMNLNSSYLQILSGATEVPYHADGEEEVLYSVEDITTVINAANTHKAYNLAYFNSLKKWINALRKINTISEVKYGSEIPKKYQSAYFASLSGKVDS